jgi:hypothetical protein
MSVQTSGLAAQVPVWSPSPHVALLGKLQNKASAQVVPSKPPHVLPTPTPVPGPEVVPPEFMQSPAVGQSSPTTPELLQPLAAIARGDSAKIGKSQAQCARVALRSMRF